MLKWWHKNDMHHHLAKRIMAWHLGMLDSNSLQERMFLVNKHIDSTLQQNLGNAKFDMLLILAFNKAFIKDMESKDLFTIDNLITSLRLAVDATKGTVNIIKYFDLDGNVEDDEMDEGMEIVVMLKSAARDISNNTMRTSLPLPERRFTMNTWHQFAGD